MGDIENSLRYYTPAFKDKVKALLGEINPVAATALVVGLHKEFLVTQALVIGEALGDTTGDVAIAEATKKLNAFHTDVTSIVGAEALARRNRLAETLAMLKI